ncbi:MAG: hypothetical protein M1831_004494 [Alyxoria varia]|nr:MAG: hypothetical protein M1831_004494 [Alyxoria varia]
MLQSTSSFSYRHDHPVRIPKLLVRNKNDSSTHVIGTVSRLAVPGAVPAASDDSTRSPRASPTSTPSTTSLHSQDGDKSTPPQKPTKKTKSKKGLVSLLTLKEPSTLAFEQYAATQRKAAAVKGSQTVGLSSVSQQKLPENVPKVNSKWDGMPVAARERSIDSKRSGDSQSFIHSKASTARSKPSSSGSSGSNSWPTSSNPRSPMQASFNPQHSSLQTNLTTPPASPGFPLGFGGQKANPPTSSQSKPAEYGPKSLPSPLPSPDPKPDATPLSSTLPQQTNDTPDCPQDTRSGTEPELPNSPEDLYPESPHTTQLLLSSLAETSIPAAPENNTQWPLPTPTSDIIYNPPASPPPIPDKSSRRQSDPRMGNLTINMSDAQNAESENIAQAVTLDEPVHYNEPVRRDLPRGIPNFTRPFSATPPASPGPTTPGEPDPNDVAGPFVPSFFEPSSAPMANTLCRASSVDRSLAPIPESDSASVMTTIRSVGDQEDALDEQDAEEGRWIVESSRASISSEMSAQWYQSPRERLGLGGFIKHDTGGLPWPNKVEEDPGYVLGHEIGQACGGQEEKDGKGWKRTSLLGMSLRRK